MHCGEVRLLVPVLPIGRKIQRETPLSSQTVNRLCDSEVQYRRETAGKKTRNMSHLTDLVPFPVK